LIDLSGGNKNGLGSLMQGQHKLIATVLITVWPARGF